MPSPDILASISSIVAGFGIAVLLFRVQREMQMAKEGEKVWIPGSDRMLIAAVALSLFFVLLPIISVHFSSEVSSRIPVACCAASLVLMTGYPLSILAHYRLIFSQNASGERSETEPAESTIIILTVLTAIIIGIVIIRVGQITL
jgi:uncharacterized membrane protein